MRDAPPCHYGHSVMPVAGQALCDGFPGGCDAAQRGRQPVVSVTVRAGGSGSRGGRFCFFDVAEGEVYEKRYVKT